MGPTATQQTIQPHLGYKSLSLFTRQEACVLRRCRIGHTHLTHSYLLKGEDPPMCIPCQCPLTVKHILCECWDTAQTRETFYPINISIINLFNQFGEHRVLDFIKAVQLFDKL